MSQPPSDKGSNNTANQTPKPGQGEDRPKKHQRSRPRKKKSEKKDGAESEKLQLNNKEGEASVQQHESGGGQSSKKTENADSNKGVKPKQRPSRRKPKTKAQAVEGAVDEAIDTKKDEDPESKSNDRHKKKKPRRRDGAAKGADGKSLAENKGTEAAKSASEDKSGQAETVDGKSKPKRTRQRKPKVKGGPGEEGAGKKSIGERNEADTTTQEGEKKSKSDDPKHRTRGPKKKQEVAGATDGQGNKEKRVGSSRKERSESTKKDSTSESKLENKISSAPDGSVAKPIKPTILKPTSNVKTLKSVLKKDDKSKVKAVRILLPENGSQGQAKAEPERKRKLLERLRRALLKVIIRCLPPDLPEHIFWKSVEPCLPWFDREKVSEFTKTEKEIPIDDKDAKKSASSGENGNGDQNLDTGETIKDESSRGSKKIGTKSATKVVSVDFYTSPNLEVLDHGLFWRSFIPGKVSSSSAKISTQSRAYIIFKTKEEVDYFIGRYNRHAFVDNNNRKTHAIVELAPYQGHPNKPPAKANPSEDTIEDDADFTAFLDSLVNPKKESEETKEPQVETVIPKPSNGALTYSELIEKTKPKESPQVTPLIEYIRQLSLKDTKKKSGSKKSGGKLEGGKKSAKQSKSHSKAKG
ncbi:hypothetical protein H4219_002265 [Mycoemilia scoparia]|uniref:UPF3 domain-containing protein n=1 Tax=Mycoemilia scoparia TaxID=417184 RepID=A0A9W7ZY23_9FUNG|nr:hypothetical protein H4219_002265 [Mycoemilia scoparia]